MKKDNKKLYESIMTSVAKEVKKALNENEQNNQFNKDEQKIFEYVNDQIKDIQKFINIYIEDGPNGKQKNAYLIKSFNSTIFLLKYFLYLLEITKNNRQIGTYYKNDEAADDKYSLVKICKKVLNLVENNEL